MYCPWFSSGRQCMSQSCAPHSARYSGLSQTCSTFWIPMKFLKCNNGTAMQSQKPWWTGTKGKVNTFLDETWAHSYEPKLKRQSNEWKHPSSPRPKKVRSTQCVEWFQWGNITPRCTTKADCKLCLLVQVPVKPFSSSAQEKTTLGGGGGCGTELYLFFTPLLQSRTSCAAGMRDSGTSTVQANIESTQLRSLRQSERITALIHTIGWSIRNINKNGRADGVQCLTYILQKVINKGGNYIEGT